MFGKSIILSNIKFIGIINTYAINTPKTPDNNPIMIFSILNNLIISLFLLPNTLNMLTSLFRSRVDA